jgi:aspartyl-tRNA(Asn)/glutamyl-tRNA(Gln) amidotransferase subunit A
MTQPLPPAAAGLEALARDFREGRSTAAQLARRALDRIAALEPRLNAFLHLDAARALAHAQALDRLRAAGIDLGPLMGVPVVVKDHFSVKGMPTAAGTRLDIQDLVAPQGPFVESLLSGGCVLLGKTRATEFALGGFNLTSPPPWNPCDAGQPRMTGGSSHGSAVAMAAGLVGFAAGSDTGGSVRWPAALCGVVGYKASASHWSCEGVFPLAAELDSLGIFTHSARDAWWVEAALARRAPAALPPPDTVTVALPRAHFLEQLDDAVGATFELAVRKLVDAGFRVREIELPEAREIDEVFKSLVPAELLAFLGRARLEGQLHRLDPVAADRLQAAFSLPADDYVRLRRRRLEIQRSVKRRLQGFDAWLSPTVPVLPAPTSAFTSVAEVAAWNALCTRNTRPGNLFGHCGISLPVQHLSASLPVGLQLCANGGEDASLLALACTVEQVLGRPEAAAERLPL